MRKLFALVAVLTALTVGAGTAQSAAVTCQGYFTGPGWTTETQIAGNVTVSCTEIVASLYLKSCLQRVTGYTISGSPIWSNVKCISDITYGQTSNTTTVPYNCVSFPSTAAKWRMWGQSTATSRSGVTGTDTGHNGSTPLRCK